MTLVQIIFTHPLGRYSKLKKYEIRKFVKSHMSKNANVTSKKDLTPIFITIFFTHFGKYGNIQKKYTSIFDDE